MSVRAFLSRSLGILALLLSVLTAFACRGPWLKTEPSWMVAVPLGIIVLLVLGGIKLLRMPIVRKDLSVSKWNQRLIKICIGCAALGGVILTSFLHGNSNEDQNGIQLLHRVALEFLIIPVPVPVVIGIMLYRHLQYRKLRATNPSGIVVTKI